MADPPEPRASPEALLAMAAREGRGRLKVFLGMAPGVGKTYAMLAAARRRKMEGIDVVVGVVETHGRAETEALLAGLEVLPRRSMAHRGRALMEFDLDAALKRRPRLVLVDELAHSNAPGSRHPKRWQDVEELLAAGIDVDATLNVQHLESLNDVILKITGVRVRETLPDHVLEHSDEIELIDLTPEDLRKRLAEGKIYVPANAQAAAENFFRPSNLHALRELALRRTAERVDEQLVEQMRSQAIEGPWAAGECILVCLGPDDRSTGLVRQAKRMADLMNARLIAVTVERQQFEADAGRVRVAEAMRFAESLGAEAHTLIGDDLPAAILRFARRENVTQIVIGRSRGGRLSEAFGRSLVHELVRQAGDIGVHVVSTEPGPETPPPVRRVGWRQEAVAASGAIAIVAAAGLIAAALSGLGPLPNLAMVFLAGVMVTAVFFGRWASIGASVLSFLAYNFFFTEPYYTFAISSPHDLLTVTMFLVVAGFTSVLAGRARDRAAAATRRLRITRTLYDFARKLNGTADLDGLLWAIAAQLAGVIGGRVVVLLPQGSALVQRIAYPPEVELDAGADAAARWAWDKQEPAGLGTGTLPSAGFQFRPLKTARGKVAVIGQAPGAEAARDRELEQIVQAMLDQAAVAIERAVLIDEMAVTRAAAESEKLRNALLSSISHDLRTPLASILGSASSLIEYGDSIDAASRRDLIVTIREESERLNRFVANLLDLTRLQAGALEIRRDWIDARDPIAAARARAERLLGRRVVGLQLAPDLPPVRLDHALLEQVLFNLLDNAIRYSEDGTQIEIAARVADGALEIVVADQGAGIAAEHLPRIFDRFYRVPHAGGAGTGLGLAICKGIVEALGGTIAARSPWGKWSTAMVVRFPLGEAR